MKTFLTAIVILFLTAPASAGKNFHNSRSCLPSAVKAELKLVEAKFGKVTSISTFRKNAIVRGTRSRSKHASCQAIDFKIKKKWPAYRYLNAKWPYQLGIYCNKLNHIHLGMGRKARWVKGCRR